MCGRFVMHAEENDICQLFHIKKTKYSLSPSWNIAPTHSVAVIVSHKNERILTSMRWGLLPSWRHTPKESQPLINARAETLQQKASFRQAFRSQRCLILAHGFYEWKRIGKQKFPSYIHFSSGRLFAMAGLWEKWTDPENRSVIHSCTVVTTEANEKIAHLHHRMPVILDHSDYDTWLSNQDENHNGLQKLLKPCPKEWLSLLSVNPKVNTVSSNDPSCIDPFTAPYKPTQLSLFDEST